MARKTWVVVCNFRIFWFSDTNLNTCSMDALGKKTGAQKAEIEKLINVQPQAMCLGCVFNE